MLQNEEEPFWAELADADRVRLIAHELALAGWPLKATEALQEEADVLEEEGRPHTPRLSAK